MIEIRHIHKSFGAVEVLKDISATFSDGEVVAIIGPSGGGKSTLIRCINGLEPLSAGDIHVDGKSVRDRAALTDIRTSCPMVFQQFNLYPHLKVLANITLAPVRGAETTREKLPRRKRASSSRWSALPIAPTPIRRSSLEASSSGSVSAARLRWSRGISSSTR